uniref:C2H2-type domain-containing protein n=1 Tax=Sparus aurata TaxID=8175 RepID=A0A671TSX7_SPAAU
MSQEELCCSQEGEQLVLKQENDTSMLIPPYEESNHSEPEPNSNHQLLSHNSHVAESQNQEGGKNGDSRTTRAANSKPKKRRNTHKGPKSIKCDTCDFRSSGKLWEHMKVHTGEKPYSCNTCGKLFARSNQLGVHMRKQHTGKKLHLCKTCHKGFSHLPQLKKHMSIHES